MSFATSKSDGSSFGSFEFSSRGPTVTSRDRDSTFTTSRGSTLLDASFKSVATTAKRSSLNSLTKDFTINKLRFKPGVLYGREKEQHVLQQSLERLTCHSKDRKKELVLISGVSGVGKTALANSITKGTSATVVSGKYDSQLRYEPYAGIVMAVGEVCGKILSLSDNPATESQFVAFRDQLVYNLNDELSALATVLPILEEITGKSFTSDAMDANVSGEQKNRFHYAFQKFIRVVGAYFCPLVLILDDLQRADKCSLDLLQILLTDQEGPGLMVIGCYRSDEVNQKQQLPTQRAPATGCYQTDEVDEGRLLANKVSTLMEISDKYGFNTTEIVLDNLGVREVNEVLSDVLSTYHNDVLGLAEICYRKTNGNIFFLTQILKLIHDNHLLEYHIGLAKWVWKEAEIETTIEATENVVDMMRESMNSLPSGISQFLQIAACLGFMFEERILSMVWHEYLSGEDDDTNKDVSLEEILVVVIDKGFLARKIDDDTKLLWVHDTILETAFSLIPQEKVESIQSRVGELLVSKIEDKDLGDTLFVVVNLLNKGGATKKSFDQIRLAELNLRAVKIALKSAAFSSAVKYVEKGVECLPQDRWTNYYSLSLDLYSTAAEVELMMAQFDLAELHCKEILAQQDSPIVDQIRAYVILYHLLYAGGKMQDALKLCVYVLKELRCTFPKTKIAKGIVSLAGLTRIKLAAKSRTSEEIENMPLMNDRVRTETMKILDYLTTASHFTKDPMLLLATLRSYQWTLQYGLCKTSPSTFGTIGLLMGGVLFDFEAARCYGEYALQLMEKIGDTSINARVHMVVYAGALHWMKPIHAMLTPLKQGYEIGMKTGEVNRGLHNYSCYLEAALVAGRPLTAIRTECCMVVQQIREFKQETLEKYSSMLWQTVLNLTGKSKNVTILTGEAMEEDTVTEIETSLHKALFQCYKLQLYVWFGEHERAAELAISKGDSFMKASPGSCLCYTDNFMRGIALFQMARETKKVEYKKHARLVLKQICKWVEKGNPNVVHHKALLEAEMAALLGKKDKARKQYENATMTASRRGFIQDAAMANERYGEFLLNDTLDREEAAYRLENAVKLYKEWGAHAKVDSLRDKYAALWPLPSVISLTNEN